MRKAILACFFAVAAITQIANAQPVSKTPPPSLGKVFILSIGIDEYGPMRFQTCKSDALSYAAFFKQQYARSNNQTVSNATVAEYTLLDSTATRDSILGALKDIARRSGPNDIFIFNFSGVSTVKENGNKNETYFFPYDIVTKKAGALPQPTLRNPAAGVDPYERCISLQTLQAYIQLIPATNQLFISEAGPSDHFRTEFISTLMTNSPEIATVLNKNRVIIVPNGIGYDDVRCGADRIRKGPINYYITSLDSSNIYDLFKSDYAAGRVAFEIRNKAYACQSFKYDYFDIFFERKFLKDYHELLNGAGTNSRGAGTTRTAVQTTNEAGGKKYAMIVGTGKYSGGWSPLPNAVADARAVSAELRDNYGFTVQLLENKPMDSVYKAISNYYRQLQPADQLIIYFAGHGDEETSFLGDGFIVCADSKPREQDPARNTYIQHAKLQRMVSNIPARQILVILDVCHGGLFNQKILEQRRGDPEKLTFNPNVKQFLETQSAYRCRKFLSSVGSGEAFDGKPGELSPFANLLLQVLRTRGETMNGIVTLSSIYSVLQTASNNQERSKDMRIFPTRDGFGSDNPMSDFVLIPIDRSK